MKRIVGLSAVALFCGNLSVAQAQQLPPPFGQPPPDIPNPGAGTLPKCTKEYYALLKSQLEQFEKLRGASGDQILVVCDGIEKVEKMLEVAAKALGKDQDEFKGQLENYMRDIAGPLGVPRIDFRFLKHMCVQGAGEAQRAIASGIGLLKTEMDRCKTSI